MKAHKNRDYQSLLPKEAYQFLKEGNQRFVSNLRINRNLLQLVNETREGQWPFAIILSCMDSRTSAELIFDQGLGDIFSVRVAGNVVNDDILGSMEYACTASHSRLIVVLGHTKCGAIQGAVQDAKLGNLTGLIMKIKPSVDKVKSQMPESLSDEALLADAVAKENVLHSIDEILKMSPILKGLIEQGEVGLVGATYSVETGQVDFFKEMIPD